jgi:hypothetical protein
MGTSGNVYFYSTREVSDPKRRVADLLEYFAVSIIGRASINHDMSHSWERRHDTPEIEVIRGGAVLYRSGRESEHLGYKVPKEQLLSLLPHRSGVLDLGLHVTDKTAHVSEAIFRHFPPDFYVNGSLASAGIRMGWHDLWDEDPKGDGRDVYIARVSMLVGLHGPGYPMDFERAREIIAGVPEVREFKKELEEICGPLEIWADWSC